MICFKENTPPPFRRGRSLHTKEKLFFRCGRRRRRGHIVVLFAAGIFFALLFSLFHAPALLVLKAADVEVALKHHEHKHNRRQSKQPRKLLYVRIKIGKIIEKFKEPHNVANKRGNGACNKGGFIAALCAVWANCGKKNKIQHPANADYCADCAGNFDFLCKHKDKGEQKIHFLKCDTSIIIIFAAKKSLF